MKTYRNGIASLILTALLFASANTLSAGVSPYLPMNISSQLENDIEKLALYTNIPQLTKPYNIATILAHHKKIKTSHPALYKRLDKSLRSYNKQTALSHAALSLSTSDNETASPLPNQVGSSTNREYRLKAHGHLQGTPWLGVYAGVDASNERTVASGSVIAIGTRWAQLDIGYKERWWSPFQGSAQMISTNAETLPSIGLSNNTPIELFGIPVNYDVFLAQTSRQLVRYQGEWSDKNKPYFSGMHFSFQPTDWWSIGVNRMFQFGGGQRETSAKDVLRAVFDPRGADNTTEELSQDEETGNQIASVVSRMNFQDFSIYMEYAGEDTSNNKAWQLGNSAINAGLFIPSIFSEKLSITYEYSEWQMGWYSHHLYEEGISQEGAVIGHHSHAASIYPRSRGRRGNSSYLAFAWHTNAENYFDLSIRSSKHQEQEGGTALLHLSYTLRSWRLAPTISAFGGEDGGNNSIWGAQITLGLH